MGSPEVELARRQRQLFTILEEFFRRAFGARIQDVTPGFRDWIRSNARRFADRGEAAYSWVYGQLAAYYKELGIFEHASNLGGVKLVFGGSSRFTKSHLASVRKMTLYADTILIPDPILPWIESPRLEESFRHVLMAENVFFLLHLKPLVDADLPYPPIVVFPSWEKTLEAQDPQTRDAQRALVAGVLSAELGHSFENFDKLDEYARNRSEEFLSGVDERRLLIAPGGRPGDSLETGIRLYREEIRRWRSPEYQEEILQLPESTFVLMGLCERLGPMYHLLENAEELIANPTMPLTAQWYYYRLCVRFFEARLSQLGLLDGSTMAEIQALESPSHQWLGDLPIGGLVELRQRGENELFRRRMREFTSSLQGASLADINRVASEISRGIASLILDHQKTIREIQERYDRHALHNALLAGVTIAATLLPTLAPLVGVALLAPIGKLTWDAVSEHLDKRQASRSLMGILADARDDGSD